jgi:hypothetical protein
MNPKIEPLPSADRRETNNTAERNELRRSEAPWAFIPGVVGLVILAVFAFVFFSGDPTPTPDRATSSRTDVK